MKKFVAGFVVGGLLFGTVTAFAQDLKNVFFDIQSIQVDGKDVNMKSTNKPFTFNGYSYIPSYMLPELGYVAVRTPDKSGIVLRSVGQFFYPVEDKNKTKDYNVIPVTNVTSSNVVFELAYKTKNMVRDSENNTYDNYIHMMFDNNRESASFVNFSFPLHEKFRRFGAKFQLIQQETDAPLNGTITLTAHVKDDRNQEMMVKRWTLDANTKTEDITLGLRYAKEVRFNVTSTHKGQFKVALLNSAFVK